MIQNVSVISLFCDDIREEKSGAETLVGIYSDNVNVPNFPHLFPKLCIYTRLHMVPGFEAKTISISLRLPNNSIINLAQVDPEILERANSEAKQSGSPTIGIISKAISTPFIVQTAGRIAAVIEIDGQEIIGNSLNVQLVPEAS